MGDPRALSQVLINLIGNAIRFTDHGGVAVSARTELEEGMQILLHVCVTDTGVGIPADRLQDIFEPFFQLPAEGKSRSRGTGLGLSICRSLCELLGCRLEVHSTPGKGSIFSVVFSDPTSILEKAG